MITMSTSYLEELLNSCSQVKVFEFPNLETYKFVCFSCNFPFDLNKCRNISPSSDGEWVDFTYDEDGLSSIHYGVAAIK